MMVVKKTFALILILCLLLSLVACARANRRTHDAEDATSAQEDGIEDSPAELDEAGLIPAGENLPEHYLELVAGKDQLVELVQERVEAYKSGREGGLGSGHMAYPEQYPSQDGLPDIHGTGDFVIRCNEDLDSMEAIYLAVPISDGNELRMAVNKTDMDGIIGWSSGQTWFGHIDDVPWRAQDLDLYQ